MRRWWEDLGMLWQLWRVLRRYPGRPVKMTIEGRLP